MAPGKLNPFEEGPEPEEMPSIYQGPSGGSKFSLPKRASLAGSLIGLLALLVFHHRLLGNWIAAEDRPPSWDQAIHLEIAQDYKKLLAEGKTDEIKRLPPKPGMPPFPPLYQLSLVKHLDDPKPAVDTLKRNFLWFVLLVVAVWGLGILHAGDWEALAAAVLISCTPEAQSLLRNQLPDLALAAWIAAAYFAFSWSAGFMRWSGSIVFALCVAGAHLTKWSAWTYLLPLLPSCFQALKGRLTKVKALAALALIILIPAPWYMAHAPILLPKLIEASADQAVPVWDGLAVLSYLWILVRGLDTPFWALGLIALFVPSLKKSRDDSWVLAAWFFAAFIFWTIVPNRQMRFLFPAIAPMALLVPGAFPKGLTAALCAFMIFTAANFTNVYTQPFVVNVGQILTFFTSEPPAQERWPIAEILRRAEARRDPDRAFVNMTLVFNDRRFNGPVFHWEAKRLGIDTIRFRGVNKRWCELSEFVLIKTGSLGPESVVVQLPEVRRQMEDPESWFQKAYKQIDSFALPDKSEAILYQRKKNPAAPLGERKIRFDYIETPFYTAQGMALLLGDWDSIKSVYTTARLTADMLTIRGLEIRNLKADLKGLDVYPLRDNKKFLEDVRLLRLEDLYLESAEVSAESLAEFIPSRAKELSDVKVVLDGGAAIQATLKEKFTISATAFPRLEADGIAVHLARLGLGPLTIPLPKAATWRRTLKPDPEMPFRTRLAGLTLKDGRLSIP